MKKIAIFFLIVLGIVSTISYLYLNNVRIQKEAKRENLKFEIYTNDEIDGLKLSSLINRAVDSNIKNGVTQDSSGKYIDNEENSINIDIKFIDDDVTYNIEKIYKNGMSLFTGYYGDIIFKCIDVQYHNKTNKVKYILFEQITQ